jgi:hypothetical protein
MKRRVFRDRPHLFDLATMFRRLVRVGVNLFRRAVRSRRCAGPRREQPGNKPHRCYLSYEIRDWCRKATPPSPRCIAGHRRREHPRPSRPAAKRAAREVLPPCLRSTVYRVQPRPPFLRGQPPRHVRTSSRVLGVYRIVVSDFLDPTRLEIGLRSSSGSLA